MTPPHDESVGSVGDEAAKLLGALADWAGDQVGDSVREVNEHIAPRYVGQRLGSRTVHAIRQASPEVKAHLATAASTLLQAAADLLATASNADQPQSRVEHIDLDSTDDADEDLP